MWDVKSRIKHKIKICVGKEKVQKGNDISVWKVYNMDKRTGPPTGAALPKKVKSWSFEHTVFVLMLMPVKVCKCPLLSQ